MAMDGKRLGRAIIEVQASLAPKMAQNFHLLVTSEKGFGYRGCQFFQVRFLYNRLALVIHCDSHLSSIPLPWQLLSLIRIVLVY